MQQSTGHNSTVQSNVTEYNTVPEEVLCGDPAAGDEAPSRDRLPGLPGYTGERHEAGDLAGGEGEGHGEGLKLDALDAEIDGGDWERHQAGVGHLHYDLQQYTTVWYSTASHITVWYTTVWHATIELKNGTTLGKATCSASCSSTYAYTKAPYTILKEKLLLAVKVPKQ